VKPACGSAADIPLPGPCEMNDSSERMFTPLNLLYLFVYLGRI
jgi:hypothetical protein